MTQKERLTKELLNIYNDNSRSFVFYSTEKEVEFIADKLIANGVLVPPCKVGDTVYSYCDRLQTVLPYFIARIIIDYDKDYDDGHWDFDGIAKIDGEKLDATYFSINSFGKTVFFTHEDAEKNKDIKYGTWLPYRKDFRSDYISFTCSACCQKVKTQTPFCPFCGAKMYAD